MFGSICCEFRLDRLFPSSTTSTQTRPAPWKSSCYGQDSLGCKREDTVSDSLGSTINLDSHKPSIDSSRHYSTWECCPLFTLPLFIIEANFDFDWLTTNVIIQYRFGLEWWFIAQHAYAEALCLLGFISKLQFCLWIDLHLVVQWNFKSTNESTFQSWEFSPPNTL